MTACPGRQAFSRLARRPFGPSRSKSTSGIRTKLTSCCARVAVAAIKPNAGPSA
jgi:hypothetical protein